MTATWSTSCWPARCSGRVGGVFTFGAVLGVNVYGVSQANVLVLGWQRAWSPRVSGAGGLVDDRLGSKPVIVGSLAAIVALGLTLMTLSGAWRSGVRVIAVPVHRSCAVVGRTLLLRMARDGKEG
ncbi:integral membrane leucine and alanine rich domain protein, partial [Mycobacterium xenopi 4042]